MAFIDELKLHIRAGKGGDGVVRWLHERGKEFMGPAGGNGGPGGDIYARAIRDIGILNNYKNFASIYQLFESATSDDGELSPSEKVQCKNTLIEHITKKSILSKKVNVDEADKILDEYKKMTEDLRLLTYKIMLDKFNEKYNSLDDAQKELLREYIYNVSNTNSFRKYVDNEIKRIKEEILSFIPKIKDKTTYIKVNGVISNIDKLKHGKVVSENQLVQLMRYFELAKEIKRIVLKEKVND